MAMRSQSHRRRRRRRTSHSRVVTQPVRISHGRQFRLHSGEVLASLAVAITTIALIALVWVITERSNDADRNDLRSPTPAAPLSWLIRPVAKS